MAEIGEFLFFSAYILAALFMLLKAVGIARKRRQRKRPQSGILLARDLRDQTAKPERGDSSLRD